MKAILTILLLALPLVAKKKPEVPAPPQFKEWEQEVEKVTVSWKTEFDPEPRTERFPPSRYEQPWTPIVIRGRITNTSPEIVCYCKVVATDWNSHLWSYGYYEFVRGNDPKYGVEILDLAPGATQNFEFKAGYRVGRETGEVDGWALTCLTKAQAEFRDWKKTAAPPQYSMSMEERMARDALIDSLTSGYVGSSYDIYPSWTWREQRYYVPRSFYDSYRYRHGYRGYGHSRR